MRKTQWPALIGRQERDDALAAYRHRVMYSLAIVAVIFLLPFGLDNVYYGRHAIAGGVLFAVLILSIDALAIHFRRPPPIPFGLLIVPAIAGIAVSLEAQGFYAALWSYPLVLLFHFAMPRLRANVYSILQLVGVSFLVLHYIGPDVTIRFFVTLTLTILLINIALNIIDDLYQRLIEQTILDPLTGAFNRRHMDSCLDYAIERSRRGGAPASLLLIDIDHFKHINDRFGHAVGDKVLKALVKMINHRARKLDLLFRVGGEEFLLLLPDTREIDAMTLAEDLRAEVATPMLLPECSVTISIGVSELHPGESAHAWLKHADDALYVAKNTGRDRVIDRSSLLFPKVR